MLNYGYIYLDLFKIFYSLSSPFNPFHASTISPYQIHGLFSLFLLLHILNRYIKATQWVKCSLTNQWVYCFLRFVYFIYVYKCLSACMLPCHIYAWNHRRKEKVSDMAHACNLVPTVRRSWVQDHTELCCQF